MTEPRVTHNGRVNDTVAQTYIDGAHVVLDLNDGTEGAYRTFDRADALILAALLIAAATETELRR